jgi:hypothetical protein
VRFPLSPSFSPFLRSQQTALFFMVDDSLDEIDLN